MHDILNLVQIGSLENVIKVHSKEDILIIVQCYSTVQKNCKRNSVFFVLCSRDNSTKFHQSACKFSLSQKKFCCHLGEILLPRK